MKRMKTIVALGLGLALLTGCSGAASAGSESTKADEKTTDTVTEATENTTEQTDEQEIDVANLTGEEALELFLAVNTEENLIEEFGSLAYNKTMYKEGTVYGSVYLYKSEELYARECDGNVMIAEPDRMYGFDNEGKRVYERLLVGDNAYESILNSMFTALDFSPCSNDAVESFSVENGKCTLIMIDESEAIKQASQRYGYSGVDTTACKTVVVCDAKTFAFDSFREYYVVNGEDKISWEFVRNDQITSYDVSEEILAVVDSSETRTVTVVVDYDTDSEQRFEYEIAAEAAPAFAYDKDVYKCTYVDPDYTEIYSLAAAENDTFYLPTYEGYVNSLSDEELMKELADINSMDVILEGGETVKLTVKNHRHDYDEVVYMARDYYHCEAGEENYYDIGETRFGTFGFDPGVKYLFVFENEELRASCMANSIRKNNNYYYSEADQVFSREIKDGKLYVTIGVVLEESNQDFSFLDSYSDINSEDVVSYSDEEVVDLKTLRLESDVSSCVLKSGEIVDVTGMYYEYGVDPFVGYEEAQEEYFGGETHTITITAHKGMENEITVTRTANKDVVLNVWIFDSEMGSKLYYDEACEQEATFELPYEGLVPFDQDYTLYMK